ncbi:MAG: DNA translocase FtsK [Acidobacteria bacterium]|nr:DNA translocase FtsK [Acidobacteriota bacterium]MBS1865621.1 DNA translocase FtsK [Acidobacteriota bacterium]
MRFLTPTENKRLNELIGFLCLIVALLMAGCLLSYNPKDASFNVAGSPGAATLNWIGPFGAYSADLMFQLLGYGAFLLPIGVLAIGIKWFRSREVESQVATLIGYGLLLFSLPALLELCHVPEVRGAVHAGGAFGAIVSSVLRSGFNFGGALIVTLACFVTALFLTTSFSFSGTHAWAMSSTGPIGAAQKLGILQRAQARWHAWQEDREQKRMRQKVEANRTVGRKPAPAQSVGSAAVLNEPPKTIHLADEGDVFRGVTSEEAEEDEKPAHRTPILFLNQDKPEKTPAKKSDPRIAKENPNYKLPSVSLLREGERSQKLDEEELKMRARAIEEKCLEFDVQGRVTQINPGPVVTTFEYKPEAGIKYSRIIGLTEDLCLALQAESILIERIPGKSTIGIEVPNINRQTIALRDVIEAQEFVGSPSKLTLAMGRDLHGRIRVTDLASMPHLLIAGSTGTGKSVFINSLMMSILYKATPDDVKMVLVDPKRLELNLYEGIPHLIAPVVTDPKVASNVLRNATREMENRLKLLAQRGVRNIEQYNRTFQKQQSLSLFENAEQNEHKPLPYLVIIIDELADLMMVDTNNVEESITRLAQMARAVGIHLILATQRPSVDVITGLIKANFPARISFRVASKVDSRTILDSNGSESLLGKGDMLYLPAGSSRLHRIHGPLVSEDEIVDVCNFWRQQAQAKYNEQLLEAPRDENGKLEEGFEGAPNGGEGGGEEADDELYQDAVRICCEMGRASTSTLQRRLRIGYGRAAHLIDLMEKDGIVGPPDGTRPREVLKGKGWMKEFDESMH